VNFQTLGAERFISLVLKVDYLLQSSNLIFFKAILPHGQSRHTHTHTKPTYFLHTQSFTLTGSYIAPSEHTALIFLGFINLEQK